MISGWFLLFLFSRFTSQVNPEGCTPRSSLPTTTNRLLFQIYSILVMPFYALTTSPLPHSASLVLFAYLCGTASQFLSVHIVCKVSLGRPVALKVWSLRQKNQHHGGTTKSETLSEGPASCVLASPWGGEHIWASGRWYRHLSISSCVHTSDAATFVAQNWPCQEYLHNRNWQTIQIRAFYPSKHLLNIFQLTTASRWFWHTLKFENIFIDYILYPAQKY